MNTQIYFKDFEKIGNIEFLSEVGARLNQDWWIYTGYKKSSELLYQYLENNWNENESLLDQLVYPIYFNYRTAIEILYKKLVYLFTKDKSIKLNHNILYFHNELIKILPSKY